MDNGWESNPGSLVSLHFHGSKIVCGYIFLPLETRPPMGSSRNSRNSSTSSIPSACYVFMLDYTITIWASIQSSLINVQRVYIYIYAIYEYMARLTSRTINQLADFQRGETARLHLERRILGRAEKQKEKKKKKKKG